MAGSQFSFMSPFSAVLPPSKTPCTGLAMGQKTSSKPETRKVL